MRRAGGGGAAAAAAVLALAALPLLAAATPCGEARMRCAYRSGCGAALNNYMMYCADVMAGPAPARNCPEPCQHAIIALTSTEEGKELMNCECEEDEYCVQSKERVDVCRAAVLRTTQNATVSCRLSQLICAADAQCATALDYYHRLCRSMFHGRKCSHKCRNSIGILRKQEKAAMLERCRCDGSEDFDCLRIQSNTARLCFRKRQGEVRGGGDPAVGGGRGRPPTADRDRPPPASPAAPASAATAELSASTLLAVVVALLTAAGPREAAA